MNVETFMIKMNVTHDKNYFHSCPNLLQQLLVRTAMYKYAGCTHMAPDVIYTVVSVNSDS